MIKNTFRAAHWRALGALGVAAALTGAVGLVAASPAEAASIQVTNVDLAWSLNDESNYASMQPGAYNFLSAGIVAKTSASDLVTQSEWKQQDGDVEVQKKQADGTFAAATWAGLTTNVAGTPLNPGFSADYNGPSGNQIVLHDGTGTLDAVNDDATISWDGAFSVIYYSGLTQWYAKDLKLVIEGSTGWLTATVGGYGTSMDDGTKFVTLPEQQNVHLAQLSNVDVTELGLTVTPDYPLLTVDGTRTKSWPSDFVAFQNLTGQSSYWYASGGSADARKTPNPLAVKVVTDATPTLVPTVTTANVTDGIKVAWTGSNLPVGEIFDIFIVPGGTDLSTRPANLALLSSTWIGNADADGNAVGDSPIQVPYTKLTAGGAYTLVAWSNSHLSKTKGLFASAPVVLSDEQEGALFPQAPVVEQDPQSTEVRVGRDAAFTASATGRPAPAVQWEQAVAGSEEWSPITGATSATLTLSSVTAQQDGLEVRAVFSNATGSVTSGAATLAVLAPVAPAEPLPPVLSVSGADLTVSWQAPDAGGSPITSYVVTLTSASGATLTRTVAAEATSATFASVPAGTWTAAVVAASAVGSSVPSPASAATTVTASGTGPTAPLVVTAVSAPAVRQVYGKTAKIAVTVSRATSGTVSAKIGSVTVKAAVSTTGRASLTIPAKALKPGERSVTLSYAGVAGKFSASTSTARVTVAKAPAKVKVTSKKSVRRGKKLTVSVRVTAVGLVPRGKVKVSGASKSKTVRLNAKGRVTVKVGVPRSAKTGTRKIKVRYAGSSTSAIATTTVKVAVKR